MGGGERKTSKTNVFRSVKYTGISFERVKKIRKKRIKTCPWVMEKTAVPISHEPTHLTLASKSATPSFSKTVPLTLLARYEYSQKKGRDRTLLRGSSVIRTNDVHKKKRNFPYMLITRFGLTTFSRNTTLLTNGESACQPRPAHQPLEQGLVPALTSPRCSGSAYFE